MRFEVDQLRLIISVISLLINLSADVLLKRRDGEEIVYFRSAAAENAGFRNGLRNHVATVTKRVSGSL